MTSIFTFFRQVRAELQKVSWPSRNEVIKNTFIVILFSAIFAVILSAADYGFLKLFELFINKAL